MKKYYFITVTAIVLVGFALLVNKSNHFSALEIDKNITRQEYLGSGLGRIYGNRIGVYYFTNVYPKFVKVEQGFFFLFNNPFVYMTIFGSIAYFGWRKNEEN